MRNTAAAPFTVLGLALALAACGATAVVAPPAHDTPPVAPPTAQPSAEAPESPAVDPSPTLRATPLPVPTEDPADEPTVAPEPKPDPTKAPTQPKPSAPIVWTDAERDLLEELRVDAHVACAPRRADLPDGATAGVECRIGSSLVDRVGIYRFADQDSILPVYLDRLANYGVEPRTGACELGVPGDSAYGPGEDEGTPLMTWRSGCFHDENGKANLRLICDTTYVGVLGATDDIDALEAWASIIDENFPGETPSSHGLCYGPADAWG